MNAGTLDRVIAIQINTPTTNAYGEQFESWADLYGKVFANVKPYQGTETFQGNQIQDTFDTVFTIRYLNAATILPTHRIVYRGEKYNIVNVLNVDERNRTLQILGKRST